MSFPLLRALILGLAIELHCWSWDHLKTCNCHEHALVVQVFTSPWKPTEPTGSQQSWQQMQKSSPGITLKISISARSWAAAFQLRGTNYYLCYLILPNTFWWPAIKHYFWLNILFYTLFSLTSQYSLNIRNMGMYYLNSLTQLLCELNWSQTVWSNLKKK